jgi:hypothetical protein
LSLINEYQDTFAQAERAMLFLIVFTGLIAAACLSGLPSTTCYALADAYTIAIGFLGTLFLLAFIVSLAIVVLHWRCKSTNFSTIKTIWFRIGFSSVILLFAFYFASTINLTVNGVHNIRLAIDHCLEDTPQQKHNPNDRIPLIRKPFTQTPT